jgi:hypothetical protein
MNHNTVHDDLPILGPVERTGNIGEVTPSLQRATFSTHVTARDLDMLEPLPGDLERHARAAPLVRSRGPSGLLLRTLADSSPTQAVRPPTAPERARAPRPPCDAAARANGPRLAHSPSRAGCLPSKFPAG